MRTNETAGMGWGKIAAIIVASVAVTTLVMAAFFYWWLFPRPFKPVHLNPQEERRLEAKLARLPGLSAVQAKTISEESASDSRQAREEADFDDQGRLIPKPYSEREEDREIVLTERELNALLANNTNLASKVAIDLAEDLVSLRMLLPVDPDFPVLGGRTIRVRAGVELAYRDERPVVIIRGLSVMGVPLPGSWLGGLKNIDLVREFGDQQGFWQAFGEGVDTIRVREGELFIRLKE